MLRDGNSNPVSQSRIASDLNWPDIFTVGSGRFWVHRLARDTRRDRRPSQTLLFEVVLFCRPNHFPAGPNLHGAVEFLVLAWPSLAHHGPEISRNVAVPTANHRPMLLFFSTLAVVEFLAPGSP